MPANWSQITVYFAITIILGLVDWTGLARAVRSKLFSLREEDYVLAARLMGASTKRIIGLHLIPGFMSHLIASATITIPTMILGETALSFLGLGLRAPAVSWGILLENARDINVVALTPWLRLEEALLHYLEATEGYLLVQEIQFYCAQQQVERPCFHKQ